MTTLIVITSIDGLDIVGRSEPPAAAQVCAYVTNFESSTVSVIDTAKNQVVDTITVGDGPVGVAAVPGGAAVYVANFESNTVSVIDTAAHRVARTVAVGMGPSGVAATPDGRKVYVTNHFSDSISVLDTADRAVSRTIFLPVADCADVVDCGLNGVAVNPSGTRAYVAGAQRGTADGDFKVSLSVINTTTDTVVPKIIDFGTIFFFGGVFPPGPFPASVAVDPSGAPVYLTDQVKFLLRTYTATGNTQIAALDFSANDIAVAPQGGTLYATHEDCDTVDNLLFCYGAVSTIDSGLHGVMSTVRTTACEPFDPFTCSGCDAEARCFATGVATDPSGAFLYVSNLHTGSVSVIDSATHRLVSDIPVGDGPLKIAVAAIPGGCSNPPTPTPTPTRTPTATPSATPIVFTAPCAGDCNDDKEVSVSELIVGVNIALGAEGLDGCDAFDISGDGGVTIDELIAAVEASLNGCLEIFPLPVEG